jgi:hypothetical protein
MLDKFSIITVNPKNPLKSVILDGVCQFGIADVLLGSVATPLSEMIWLDTPIAFGQKNIYSTS